MFEDACSIDIFAFSASKFSNKFKAVDHFLHCRLHWLRVKIGITLS